MEKGNEDLLLLIKNLKKDIDKQNKANEALFKALNDALKDKAPDLYNSYNGYKKLRGLI